MNVTTVPNKKKSNLIKSGFGKKKDNYNITDKQSIWIKILGTTKYDLLREMNNSDLTIIKWQKQRVFKTLFILPLILAFYKVSGEVIFLVGGFIVMFLFYMMEAKNINKLYTQFKFERHLEFSKFQRLLVPYLTKGEDSNNLWSIYNKLLDRLKYETDKKLLMNLMNDMVESPHDIEPFETFAKNMSNTDNSHLFMGTIFDIREGSADLDVIEELDRLASEELMDMITSIIDYKSSKFMIFPTTTTMIMLLPMIGYFAGFVLNTIKELNFLN